MWSERQIWRIARRVSDLLSVFLLAAAPAAAATFSDPMTLSKGGESTTPAVAVTGSGQVYVAWREGNDIWFNRSGQSAGSSCGVANGLEFPDPPQNLSKIDATKILRAHSPSVAASDGGVFVVWRELALDGSGPSIRFARSMDRGGTFTSPVSLTFNQSGPRAPSVAADDSGGVFVVWQDFNPGTGKDFVAIAQSLNGGAFTYTNVTTNRESSSQPSVAAFDSVVHVVWQESGVSYKGFARGSSQAAVDAAQVTQFGTVSSRSPKVAVHAGDVTAAWFEGGNIKARKKMRGGTTFGSEEPIYSSSMELFNLSLSFGGAGRFVVWLEKVDFLSPTSIRYRLGTSSPETLPSSSSEVNRAAPSGGQDAVDRLVVGWQATVETTEVRLAYTGGSGGGATMTAKVWAAHRVLNYRTVGRGTGQQPNFTVFIELPDGSAGDINLSTVKFNSYSPLPHPSSLGDHNGNGIPDLMVKFNRSVFDGAELTAAQRAGNYTVTGNTGSGGCFSGSGAVQIMR